MLMSSTSDRGGFAAIMYNLSFSHVLFEDLDKAFHFKSSVYYETAQFSELAYVIPGVLQRCRVCLL